MHPDRTGPDDSADKSALLLREKRAVEKAQAGDLAALEPILASHAEALFMGILGRVGERAQAELAVRVTLHRDAVDRVRPIEHHEPLAALRRGTSEVEEACSIEEATAPLLLSAAEERVIAQRRIEDVLAGIHARYATVIRLRLCEEKPRAVCAAALGVSVETFDVLLLRAVRAFRKAYGEPDAG